MSRFTVSVCARCGVLLENDRDYGLTPAEGRCGDARRQCGTYAHTIGWLADDPEPGVRVIEVVPASDLDDARERLESTTREHFGGSPWAVEFNALMAERDARQAAIDKALVALESSAYIGGPTERDAWQACVAALGPFRTEHTGVADNG